MDSASGTPASRPTDRVLEALSALVGMLDRTIREVKSLDTQFQDRILRAVEEAQTTVQTEAAQHLDAVLAETRSRLEERFANDVADLRAQWEEERNRLNSELAKMSQNAVQWETERHRLNKELERLGRIQAATQAEAEKAILAVKSATAAAKSSRAAGSDVLNKEMERVEGLIKEISALIDDPATDLSTVIRKNVERAEFESYLKGIRFALNGGQSK
jgi:chromosome segregation ATPase